MRTHVAVLLLFCFPAIAHAAPATDRDAQRLDDIVKRAETEGIVYPVPDGESLAGIAGRMIIQRRPAAEICDAFKRTWHLSDEGARLTLEAFARNAIFHAMYSPDEPDKILDLLKDALRKDSNDAIAVELISFATGESPDASDAVEFALRAAPHPRDVAVASLASLAQLDVAAMALDIATRGGVDDPLVLIAVSNWTENPIFCIRAYERRRDLGALTTGQLAALAENAIAALTANGSSREAIAIFESLPPEAQSEVVSFPSSKHDPVSFNRGVVRLQLQRTAAGLDIAAAYALEGRYEKAAAIVAALHGVPSDPDNGTPAPFDRAIESLIEATTSRSPVDAFEIVAGFIAATVAHDDRSNDQVVLELFDRFAAANGYGRVSEYLFDRARYSREESSARNLPPVLDAIVSRYSHAGVPEQIEANAHDVFEADGIERVPLRKEADCSSVEKLVEEGVVFPKEFTPVRAERRGNRIVGVCLSRIVDPESVGGYWIIDSPDRGLSWTTLYTGLRESEPYTLIEDSSLPLFDDAGIMLDVYRAEDLERLYVHCSWDDLERDTDGDGLTDILEARLGTDPRKKDTDGDGVDDLDDPLPQVAYTADSDAGIEVLAHVLEDEVKLDLFADHDTRRPPRIVDPTANVTYFMGDRSLFASFRPRSRVIVLSPSEFHAWKTRMADFHAIAVSAIAIDPLGVNAAVAIDQYYTSDIYLLEKTSSGRWQSKVAGGPGMR